MFDGPRERPPVPASLIFDQAVDVFVVLDLAEGHGGVLRDERMLRLRNGCCSRVLARAARGFGEEGLDVGGPFPPGRGRCLRLFQYLHLPRPGLLLVECSSSCSATAAALGEVLLVVVRGELPAHLARLQGGDVAGLEGGGGGGGHEEWGGEGGLVVLVATLQAAARPLRGVEGGGGAEDLVDHLEAGREVEGEELPHVEELVGRRGRGVRVPVGRAREALLELEVGGGGGVVEDAAVEGGMVVIVHLHVDVVFFFLGRR